MQKIFYMCIWYFVALCKFFVLVWHNILPFNKVGIYFKMKAENFLFFSPRVYKKFRLQKEVKQNCTSVRLFTKDMVRIHASFLKPLDGKPVVIFFHGQSENITKWQDTFLFLKKFQGDSHAAILASLLCKFRPDRHFRLCGTRLRNQRF